ncbi:lysophospholipid acyltransferase family protein [Winogradskyella sp. SYSU M77433]|uniref:lysophospholipid acyltransferase family protein n=1 Tax=Winogradskyella sp. SYSU M77433 TaxID=3042722 RepID=UPI002480F9F6|nr:lysophospholipid acyltransferase family protein [Winogradskyella sp. SYSU M77433]MDH7913605.1 lysophospholipid acyltransferase family protein [Winogradskyella sp. SYSU M77433]
MQKLLAYPLTILYFICFGLTLVIFHPIQWFCFNVFGYKAHKISVDWLQFFIMRSLNVLGTRFTFINPYAIEEGVPLIIVANHQSMYDIPPLIWYMRKHHVKFISKKELGKGIPSVSYNLRHGGSVLIDRKDALGSIKAIESFAQRIDQNKWAAVIFPEGTRSRDGKPKPFKTKGLLTMLKNMPNALVVPVTINNSWKTLRYGKFPMGIGAHIKFRVHQPINPKDYEYLTDLVEITEKLVKSNIQNED